MKVDVLLGLQWGDEGKGKVVDVLTPRYDVVARFQGGPNAGHTLEFEGQKYVLRSIPSGIFQGNKVNIIGNGVVLDPALFKAEAEALEASGHPLKERLHISKKAHLILPTHRILDAAYEAAKGDAKVGTTGKGIGPTYTDKVSRNGVRVGDILHNFDQKYAAAKARHEQILKSLNYEYDLAEQTQRERARLEQTDYMAYLVMDGGQCAGYFSYGAASHGGYKDFSFCLNSLYLLPPYQHMGLGRRIFAQVRQAARERKLDSFFCGCNVHNLPARRFYEKMGGVVGEIDDGHENLAEDQMYFEFCTGEQI